MDIYTLFRTYRDKDVLLEVVKYKPNINIQNDYSDTIALYAFQNCKDKDVLIEILKLKPDLNIQDNCDHSTIIMYAYINCIYNEVLIEILKQKPDLTVKNYYDKNALDYALENYIKSPNFEFDVLEKLYDENYKQNKQLVNLDYIRIKRKYKILPLILFGHQKRYGV